MKQALLFDQQLLPENELFQPFALTDLLTEFSGKQQQPIIHFWQLPQTLILGMKDSRVPDLTEAVQTVHQQGYHVILRNAGGLGVINDSGILNVSLILPKTPGTLHSIDDGYQAMVDWLKATPYGSDLEIGEVPDSYCPGKFDLSLKDQKIAGIAQRRVKDGIAIMMYLSIHGNQQARGEIVRSFYQSGLKKAFGQGYPPVNPASMTTLADVTQQPLAVATVKQELLKVYDHHDQTAFLPNFYQTEDYQRRIHNMHQRNLVIQEVLNDL